MKTLHSYLKENLTRSDPHPAIDHLMRAQLHEDGRLSFYIHAHGRDSDTADFWVSADDTLKEKRLRDEPLPDGIREKVAAAAKTVRGTWGIGNLNAIVVQMPKDGPSLVPQITAAIETVEGVMANYCGTEGDDYYVFRPHLG